MYVVVIFFVLPPVLGLSVRGVRSDGGCELGLPLVAVGKEFLC